VLTQQTLKQSNNQAIKQYRRLKQSSNPARPQGAALSTAYLNQICEKAFKQSNNQAI
jgi:hypothetical protein